MNSEILRRLQKITKEEKELLSGKAIDRERYAGGEEFVVDSEKMLARGKLIDIRTHTRFVDFPEHKHNYIEIIYMVSGTTTHVVNQNMTVELEAGDLLFLNQYASHSIGAAGEQDIGINFIVLPEFFDVAFSMLEDDNELKNFLVDTLRQRESGAGYLHFKVAGVMPVQNLIENMTWSLLEKESNRGKINQVTMGLLFLQLMNYTNYLEGDNKRQAENRTVMNALRYIEENYRLGTLAELAAQEAVNIYRMSRLIKAHTGYTFKELLQIKRLNKAAELLKRSQLPILDIMSAVGYDNSSYFYRIFRMKYKMSPREYRLNEE